MPDGASRKDLRRRKAYFHQCAIQNALLWYQFANEHLDTETPNGSLILVTGCDMASSWGIASFSDVLEDVEVELNFTPSYRDNLSCTYLWQTNVSASVRTNPGLESIPALHQTDSGLQSVSRNQPAPETIRDPPSLPASQDYHHVNASRSIFNDVGGYQVNVTNHIMLPSAGNVCRC